MTHTPQPPAPAFNGQPAFLQLDAASGDDTASLLAGLMGTPARIAPWHFYDDIGSRLFAAITALPEYYPTRTEAEIFARQLPEIARVIGPPGVTLIDLGAGNCEKAARLFDALQPTQYVAVDISADFLRDSLQGLQQRHPQIRMLGVGMDFSRHLPLPDVVRAERRLFFYPGSSIGNFDPAQAHRLLAQVRAQMGRDGALLIGADLLKPRDILVRAYDDALGVTAAFNRNVLRHVNAKAGTDFDVEDWQHVALFNEEAGRIEMHLEAGRDVVVRWPGGERRFVAGERIHTENSHKYTVAGFEALLASAGLRSTACWSDRRGWFGVFLARPAT